MIHLVPFALLAPPALLDGQDLPTADSFAPPVRVEAGDAFLGATRLYPSPVLHDVDGDGRADLVVGDLPGKLTVAPRLEGEGTPRFGPESSMKDVEGDDIDFNNW